jgi:hypothetical protein
MKLLAITLLLLHATPSLSLPRIIDPNDCRLPKECDPIVIPPPPPPPCDPNKMDCPPPPPLALGGTPVHVCPSSCENRPLSTLPMGCWRRCKPCFTGQDCNPAECKCEVACVALWCKHKENEGVGDAFIDSLLREGLTMVRYMT